MQILQMFSKFQASNSSFNLLNLSFRMNASDVLNKSRISFSIVFVAIIVKKNNATFDFIFFFFLQQPALNSLAVSSKTTGLKSSLL